MRVRIPKSVYDPKNTGKGISMLAHKLKLSSQFSRDRNFSCEVTKDTERFKIYFHRVRQEEAREIDKI